MKARKNMNGARKHPASPRRRRKQKSFYELYPMPFFDRKNGKFWNVKPSGDSAVDCLIGNYFANRFLTTCDGTVGWSVLFSQIVQGMIHAGCYRRRGYPRCNGMVIGFLSRIGSTLSVTLSKDYRAQLASDLKRFEQRLDDERERQAQKAA